MPYKKKLFAWTTLGHFYKKIFSRKFKKKNLRIYVPLWNPFIKRNLFAWIALGHFCKKKILHNYKLLGTSVT